MFIFKFCEYICISKLTKTVKIDNCKSKDMKILIHPDLKSQIAQEFKTTNQTVLTSLSYFNNSKKAQAIRKRAQELLHEEANKIQIEKFELN